MAATVFGLMSCRSKTLANHFEPPHRQSNDLLAPDAVMPVVGDGVGWEYRKPTRREFAFDDIGSRQTGKKRRQLFGIAQCRADVGNAPVRKNACAAIYIGFADPILEPGWPGKFASAFASELLSTGEDEAVWQN